MEPTYLLATLPLFLAPLSLLVAALVLALLPVREGRRPVLVAGASVVAAGLAVVASAPAVLGGGVVIDPVLRMFRSGSLDVLLGCVLDKVSFAAAIAILVCAGGFVAASAAHKLSQRQLALALAVAGSALVAALAEGFPTLFFGLSLTFWLSLLARESEPPLRLRAVAFVGGLVSAAFAVAFMFWSLGGQWLDDARYLSDFRARFVVSSAQAEPTKRASGAPIGQGKLTILSHPGARVYLGVVDEGQLKRSDPVGETPLVRKTIPAGLQKIAIEPGGSAIVGGEGVEVALVDTVEVREDAETIISLVGPSVTFHELGAALRAGTFAARRVGGSTTGTVVGAFLCFALCAFVLALAEKPRTFAAVFGRACLLLALGALFARLGPLCSASPLFAAGGVSLVAAFAAWSVYRGAGPWFATAALIGGAAFAGAPLASVVIAAALAPALLAVAELERAPRAEEPAQAEKKAASKSRKKRKEKAPEPPSNPPQTSLPLTLVRLAASLAPVPLLGAFAGIGSAIATPFSSSVGRGLVFWVALSLAWAAFAWSMQQTVSRLAGATVDPLVLRRVLVLAGFGAVAGPAFALFLRPWSVSAAFGSTLAGLVAVASAGVVLLTAPLATRQPPPPADAEPSATAESPLPRIDALLEKIDLLVGLPLALVARLLSRREKGEPS